VDLEKLARHQHPRPPQHELRGHRVLDSGNREFGDVAGLYVDRDERKLRYLHIITTGFLGLGRKHYLMPFEDVDAEAPGMVKLRHDQETIESSPTFDPHSLPTEDYQRDIRKHYGYD
jgi:PRC-barrel domain